MSTVIGIDPSILNTGLCILSNKRGKGLFNLTTTNKDSLGERLLQLRTRFLELLTTNAQDACWLAAIEGPISPLALSPQMGGKGFNNNVMATGVLLTVLAELRIPTLVVAPMSRAKYATGKGNANKEAVHQTIRIVLGLPSSCDHNLGDALVLAYMAAEVMYVHHEKTGFKEPFTPKEGFKTMPDVAYDVIDLLYADYRDMFTL